MILQINSLTDGLRTRRMPMISSPTAVKIALSLKSFRASIKSILSFKFIRCCHCMPCFEAMSRRRFCLRGKDPGPRGL